MRVLMVTLELADPVFSGNGVYGRTVVEALLALPDTTVDVICGAPQEAEQPPFASHAALDAACSAARLRVSRVPLPVWGKVDRSSAHAAFADGAAAALAALGADRPPPDLLLGVDWTAAAAARNVRAALGGAVPLVHMNFRVFFAQLELLDGADDAAFYTEREREACEQASAVIALTSADAATLAALLPAGTLSPSVLNPPVTPQPS